MAVTNTSRSRDVVTVLMTVLVMLGIYGVMQSRWVQDTWKGWSYDEDVKMSQIRSELELTETAERVFLATQPVIESAENFNEHCNSHRVDISLLGCYTEDKIYIYEVQLPELQDTNKVTAAHELLHAIWIRMGNGERTEVVGLLEGLREMNPQWAEEETKLYQEGEKTEELYTRAGTKLRDLPVGLEEHYKNYFNNRLKIVEFYESYQAPFNELIQENERLKAQVDELGQEIDVKRAEYMARLASLEATIAEFNACADTEGCFRSMGEFTRQREGIKGEQENLKKLREQVNQKIDQNNEAVRKYQENQGLLGKLNDALNSNIEKISE